MTSRKDNAQRELEISRAYRVLFLNDDGTLKPEAEVVLRDLEKKCGWMVTRIPVTNTGNIDPLQLAVDTAKRTIYAHVKERVFAPLDKIVKLIAGESSNE